MIIGAAAGLAGVAFWLAWSSITDDAGEVAGSEHFPAALLAASHITSDARAALPVSVDAAAVGRVNERYGRECEDLMVAYRDIGLRTRWIAAQPGDRRGMFVDVASPPERVVCVVIAAGEAPPAPSSPAEEPAEVPEEEAGPEFFVEDNNSSGTEGSRVAFTVRLTPAWGQRASVDYYTEPATAAAGGDYGHVEGTLTFEPGKRSLGVQVRLLPDATIEPVDETFRFCLSDPNPGSVRRDRRCATGTIIDGDVRELPWVTISGASAQEGRVLQFAVNLSEPAPQELSIRVNTVELVGPRAAEAGVDYVELVGETVTIAAGQDRTTVLVETIQDGLFEWPELFEVRLSGVVGARLRVPEATGTIGNDDTTPPVLSVDGATAREQDQGITFNLNLSEPSGRPVVARLATRDGSATAGEDYEALEAGYEATIPAGETSVPVPVVVVDDDKVEPPESFVLSIESATAATLSPTAAEAQGRILDDDNPLPVVTVDNVTVAEGDTATFALRLSIPAPSMVAVEYETADGTGTSAATGGDDCRGTADYVSSVATWAVFEAGAEEYLVNVPTCDDSVAESLREVFQLRLTGDVGLSLADGESGVGTILDDDAVPAASVADAEANEDADEVVFTVSLDRPATKRVSLRRRSQLHRGAAHGATPAEEFAVTQGDLHIEVGGSSATVAVPIGDDTLDEHNETFWLRLGLPTDGTPANATIGDGLAVGTIVDDDPAPLLSIGDAEAIEGEELLFPVRLVDTEGRDTPSGKAVSAGVATANITATAGEDYNGLAASTDVRVRIPVGATQATVTVTSLEDEVREPDETFGVYLAGNRNAGIADRGEAIGLILDDEEPRLVVADVTVTEGTHSVASFVVALSHAADKDVTFSYRTRQLPQSAQPGGECDAEGEGDAETPTETPTEGDTGSPADFVGLAATEGTITAGEERITVEVAICDDEEAEDTETFLLAVTGIDGATGDADSVDGDTASGLATIRDDDGPQRITVEDAEASEGDGAVMFTVALSKPAVAAIDVDYRTISASTPADRDGGDGSIPTSCAGEAATGAADPTTDYVPTTGTLTFGPGDTSATIEVTIRDDAFAECPPREQFILRLALPEPDDSDDPGDPADPEEPEDPEEPDEPVAELADAEATGTIVDDDPPSTVFVYDVFANEGDASVTVRVELDKPHDRTIRVPYRTADGAGAKPGHSQWFYAGLVAPRDYGATEGVLVFPPGSVARTVTVTLIDDDETQTVADPEVIFTYEGYFWLVLNDRVAADCELRELDASGNAAANELSDCGRIYVRDDEQPYRVRFAADRSSRVLESAGEIEFTITVGGYVVKENITVRYQTEPLTHNRLSQSRYDVPEATAGADYEELTSAWMQDPGNPDCHALVARPGPSSPGEATIRAGQRAATLTVKIVNDEVAEGVEHFQVGLLGPQDPQGRLPGKSRASGPVHSGNAILDACPIATGTIVDDDTKPVLSMVGAAAPEDAGMLRFRAALSRASSATVTVAYTTADVAGANAATEGEDYEAASGTLTIPAGDLSAFIDVTLLDDDDDEGDEWFELNLATPVGATAGASEVRGTIIDDERNELPVVTVADVAVAEDPGRLTGGSGQSGLLGWMLFEIRLSKPNTNQASFSFGYEEVPSLGSYAARSGEDYRVFYSGNVAGVTRTSGFHVIPPADSEGCWLRSESAPLRGDGTRPCAHEPLVRQVWLQLIGDDVPERDEKLRLWLSSANNVVLGDAEAWGTIINNDQPILSVGNVEVSESAARAVFDVELHEPGLDPLSVRYRTAQFLAGNPATPSEDYTETTGTVTFAPGTTEAQVEVPIRPDNVDEYDEAFVLQFHDPDGVEMSNAEALALILDDDPGWWIGDAVATEGGTVSFEVRRDEPTDAAVTLRYVTYDGGATGGACGEAGVDFVAPPGSLVFAAGVTELRIDVTACDDEVAEGSETFTVSLIEVGRRTSATGTIIDND